MAAIYESTASLRFGGDDLDPDVVTRLLGQTPTLAYRKGDARRSGNSDREYSPYKIGGWHLRVADRKPADLDGQIREIFSQLTSDLGIWAELSRYKPDLFCGLFMNETNEGLSISSDTLKMIADRQIEIGFDVYGPINEE